MNVATIVEVTVVVALYGGFVVCLLSKRMSLKIGVVIGIGAVATKTASRATTLVTVARVWVWIWPELGGGQMK